MVVVALAAMLAPALVVEAQSVGSGATADAAVEALAQCPPSATVLVVAAIAPGEPEHGVLLADFVTQLAALRSRKIELLVGAAGVGFERSGPWEQVTPGNATLLVQMVSEAAAADDARILDAETALVAASSELDERAARTEGDACGLVVFSAGGESTGTRTEGTWPVYLVADDAHQLVEDLARLSTVVAGGGLTVDGVEVCDGQPCDEGTVEVELPAAIGSFSVTAVLPSDTASLEVGLPRGVAFPVADRVDGVISAGSFSISTTWPRADVVRLQAEVSPAETDWSGTWTVAVVDDDAGGEAQVITAMTAGVAPQFTSSVRLVAGRPVQLRAEVVDAGGRLVDRPEALDVLTLTARAVAEGTVLSSVDLAADELGTWSGALELDGEVGADEVSLELVATIEAGAVSLPPVQVTRTVAVLDAAVWPSVDTSPVVIRADSGAQAVEAIVVTAGSGVDACAWVEEDAIDIAGNTAPIAFAGGARSAASCVRVAADTSVELPLAVDLTDVAPGASRSSVTVAYGPMGDEAFDTVEVELVFEVLAPVNFARRVQITVGMALIALVVPLLALWLLDWIKARFRPSRRAVAAEAWVAVWSDGSVYRVDTDGSPLLLGNDDFEPAGLSRTRRFQWRGFDLGVRNPTSPLTPPVAVVGSDHAPVVASMGAIVDEGSVVGRVPLTLAPTWIFELAPEATREAALDPTAPDFFASYGRLILIRPSLDAPPVDLSELAEMAQRLARTVRRAARPASGTAQEMLDFVEVNVSAPRDLPRLSGALEPDEPDAGVDRSPVADAFAAATTASSPAADPYDFSDLAGLFADEDSPDDDPVGEAPGDSPGGAPIAGDGDAAGDAAERGNVDLGPTDHWDDIEVQTSSGYGVVFEESVNPEAFLVDDAGSGAAPSEPPSVPEEPPADPRTSWARRSKPSWPSALRRPDDR